jgi:hypothetical protein
MYLAIEPYQSSLESDGGDAANDLVVRCIVARDMLASGVRRWAESPVELGFTGEMG